jgi:endonuclease-3
VVLSAQATDKAVNRVTGELWNHCRMPDDYLALGEERLCEKIRTIGLYRQKARSILGICQIVRDQYHDQIPDTFEELVDMPGVGRKTANVILNVLYKQPTMPVDTHVFRVANRTGLAMAKTPVGVEKSLLRRIPLEHRHNAHHYLILHGRYTCKARKPECRRCPVFDYCNYGAKHV